MGCILFLLCLEAFSEAGKRKFGSSNDEDLLGLGDLGSRSEKRSRTHAHHQIQKSKADDDDFSEEDLIDIDEDTHSTPSKSAFAHSILKQDGTRICAPGYISDGKIDSRGCWRCVGGCKNTEVCVYDGICVVPVPSIAEISYKNMAFISFTGVPSGYIPSIAFCRFDNSVIVADSIANMTIQCQIPQKSENYSLVSISFDQQSWSNPRKSSNPLLMPLSATNAPASVKSSSSTATHFIVLGAIISIAAGIGLALHCIKPSNQSKHTRLAVEPRPMAYFPGVSEA